MALTNLANFFQKHSKTKKPANRMIAGFLFNFSGGEGILIEHLQDIFSILRQILNT